MHHIGSKPLRMRSYSMEEADRPRLLRGMSGDSDSLGTSPTMMGTSPPINNTPPKTDAPQPRVVKAN